jgi:hypothetical protein
MREKLRFLGLDVHAETIAVAVYTYERAFSSKKVLSKNPYRA